METQISLWYSGKAVNRGRSLALNIYINKNENKLVKHLTQKARRK